MSERREGGWSPGRVLHALGRIGYHPASAILDIADNSISALAEAVFIELRTERQKSAGPGRPKALLKAISVADNGIGMDQNGLGNALSLGSSTEYYTEGTLSKFGLGLKSAASSIGRRLEIVSRKDGELCKATLDHDLVEETGKYVYDIEAPTSAEVAELDKCAGGGSGTLVVVSKLHADSLPRTAEIQRRLSSEAGIVYFYYLKGAVPSREPLELRIDNEAVGPVDPLFETEIGGGSDGDLNEHTWDGLQPKWIERPKRIQVDTTGTRFAEVAMSQLPHPPSVERWTATSRAECRKKYLIGAGNYGFYIYRNYRLISWADDLGLVSQDQDHYAFRGRLLIDDTADDVLNIDVTKSRIHLSDIAYDQLSALVQEGLKKSRVAWKNAYQNTMASSGEDPHSEANEQLDQVSEQEQEQEELDESVATKEEQETLKKRREIAQKRKAEADEVQRLKRTGERVQYVDSLDNNQLWERAHDPTNGLIVRVNRSHRFAREIIEPSFDNAALLRVLDILFYSAARAEYELVYTSSHASDDVESIMEEYRERLGAKLSDVIRGIDVATLLNNRRL